MAVQIWWDIQNLGFSKFWNKIFYDALLMEVYVGITIEKFPFYIFLLIHASGLSIKYKFWCLAYIFEGIEI